MRTAAKASAGVKVKGRVWIATVAAVGSMAAWSTGWAQDRVNAFDRWFSLRPGMPLSEAMAAMPELRKMPCKEEDRPATAKLGMACEIWAVQEVWLGRRVFRGQIRASLDTTTVKMARLYGMVPGTAADARKNMDALEACNDAMLALEAVYGKGKELRGIMAPQRVNYVMQFEGKGKLAPVLLSCVQVKEPDAIHVTVAAMGK